MRVLMRDARGSTIVEFALVVPLLVLLTVGLLDVARALNAQVVLKSASEEGAHFAILNPSAPPSAIQDAARARTQPLDATSMAVASEYYSTAGATFLPWPSAGVPASSPNPTGVMVRVTVSYPWSAVSAIAGQFLSSSPVTLTSSTLMETRR